MSEKEQQSKPEDSGSESKPVEPEQNIWVTLKKSKELPGEENGMRKP
jgi:hypothetical protein